MVPTAIREIIIADYKDGMNAKSISHALRISERTVYRLLQKERETGSISAMSHNSGRRPELDSEGQRAMEKLVTENPDITIQEIKEVMHLSMQKSEISNILRIKLGFRYKKRWCMPANETELMS